MAVSLVRRTRHWLTLALLFFPMLSRGQATPSGAASHVPPAQISPAKAEAPPVQEVGPYLAHILPGGPALKKPLPRNIASAAAWSEWVWVRLADGLPAQTALLAGVGDPAAASSRYLIIRDGRPGVRTSAGNELLANAPISSGAWHFLLVSNDGAHLSLFVDGVLAAGGSPVPAPAAAEIQLAPLAPPASGLGRPGCKLAFNAAAFSLSAENAAVMMRQRPNFALMLFEENAKPWPMQTRQWVGYAAPQAPDLMPHGAPPQQPVAQPIPAGPALQASGEDAWTIAAGWRLLSNEGPHPLLPADGARISKPSFPDSDWLAATVPGTVLTTMIDRGIYPDPTFGLNNLGIPESLNKHDYWYRVEFPTPAGRDSHHELHFAGINYSADVWLNGVYLGEIRGAFLRGDFDVSRILRQRGENALAVRISPPPHPGIPAEQSILDGPGENGGAMVIDGPTFVATEGWDWIPAIRDRNSGLWQPVTLTASGAVTLGDPQVITRLPLPDRSSADVTLNVPVHNAEPVPERIELIAAFEGVEVRLPATVPPGDSTLHLTPAQFPALHLSHPRLWWPNGYGSPELYHLKLRLLDRAGGRSDARQLTFGVREISYELSLFDPQGRIERVEVIPTETAGKGYDAIDVRSQGIRQTVTGWASTITPQAEGTSAIRPVTNEPGMTDLVIKVNGVRIAARGGNWGMDDLLKRVSRKRLEPYFRLHREANLNIIRNWVGQDTEETFYQLADEYGMMVWNDFWESTQDDNAEAQDIALFIDNARDTVRRYRNHPSIVLWCGRNEGVPQPVLNEAMIGMLRQEDGTRYYTPSSNELNLRPSGPYQRQPPAFYFGPHNQGFSVELGISSFPTREAFAHTVAAPDRWPVSDDWAYHDWHQSGNGDTHGLMRAMDTEFGPSNSLAEFERRVQMFNYVDHRAIFEGFYRHLWTPNSGRMIWMTHPAWPSTMWQMYSSDYDTQASFYAIKNANAPVHIQMDPSDGTITAVNTTLAPLNRLTITAAAYSLSNEPLANQNTTLNLAANTAARAFELPFAGIFARAPVALVRLEMRDSAGVLAADNFYWIAKDDSAYRALDSLPAAPPQISAAAGPPATDTEGPERTYLVNVRNAQTAAALEIKLTLLDANGARVLPAYYSDNYFSLLPGESRQVSVHVPESAAGNTPLHFTVRGWNVPEQTVPIVAH